MPLIKPRRTPDDEQEPRILPTAIRVVSALVPGGVLGAAAGGIGEALAELAEGRRLNKLQIATQAGLGSIPFARLGKAGAALKGALISGGGTAGTQFAERGRLEDIEPMAVAQAAGLGALLGGGVARRGQRLPVPSTAPTAQEQRATEAIRRAKSRQAAQTRLQKEEEIRRQIERRYATPPPVERRKADVGQPIVERRGPVGEPRSVSELPGAAGLPFEHEADVTQRILQKPLVQGPSAVAARAGLEESPLFGTLRGARLPADVQAGLEREVREGRITTPTELARILKGEAELAPAPLAAARRLGPQHREARQIQAEATTPEDIETARLLTRFKGGALRQATLPPKPVSVRQEITDLNRSRTRLTAVEAELEQAKRGGVAKGRRASLIRERDDLRARLQGEGGGITPELAARLGGGAVGATIGATQGEDTEDRLVNAALGGFAGMVGAPLLLRAFRGKGGPEVPAIREALKESAPATGTLSDAIEQSRYFSMLSSLSTLTKASTGSVAGLANAALEKAIAGDPAAAMRMLRHYQENFNFKEAFLRPEAFPVPGRAGVTTPRPPWMPENVHFYLSAPQRIINAFDVLATRAMMAGGLSADEAARFTLAGHPTSKAGRKLVDAITQELPLRMLAPFSRVGVQSIERGIERSPLALIPAARRAIGSTEVPEAVHRFRAATGTGIAAAFGAGAAQEDPGGLFAHEKLPLWAAATGPFVLPASIGLAAGAAIRRGQRSLPAIGREVERQLPLAGEFSPFQDVLSGRFAASFVPNVARDVARTLDPEGRRETRRQVLERGGAGRATVELAPILEKIPGLRERLPVRQPVVNPAGQAQTRVQSPMAELFGIPPPQDLPGRILPTGTVRTELERLGIPLGQSFQQFELAPPASRFARPLAPEERTAMRQAGGQEVYRLLEALFTHPSYQGANDEVRAALIETVVERARARVAVRARAAPSQPLELERLLGRP